MNNTSKANKNQISEAELFHAAQLSNVSKLDLMAKLADQLPITTRTELAEKAGYIRQSLNQHERKIKKGAKSENS